MDINSFSPKQRQRLLAELFSHLNWFQEDGRLHDWSRLVDFKLCRSPFSRLLLSAWLDRVDVLSRVGLGWIGSTCQYRIQSGEYVDEGLDRYMREPAISECRASSAAMTDLVIVAPKVGRYQLDFAMGRYELDYLGPDHDEVIRRQQPVAVMCNDRPYEEPTPDEQHDFRRIDDAIRAHGLKVIRFSASEIESDADTCARRVDEMFKPTWSFDASSRSSHPYDDILEKVRGR